MRQPIVDAIGENLKKFEYLGLFSIDEVKKA